MMRVRSYHTAHEFEPSSASRGPRLGRPVGRRLRRHPSRGPFLLARSTRAGSSCAGECAVGCGRAVSPHDPADASVASSRCSCSPGCSGSASTRSSSTRPSGIAWLVFLGVFPTSIAFTTWAYALARGSAGRLAATAYLVPPITIVMSWLVLGEVPTVIAVLGGALCLVGVAIARKAPAPRASPPAPVPPAPRP